MVTEMLHEVVSTVSVLVDFDADICLHIFLNKMYILNFITKNEYLSEWILQSIKTVSFKG